MNNKFDKASVLAYINNHISKESIDVLYSSNNIIYAKCELYGDFVQSLLMIAFDTYMGDKLTSFDEQKNHFKWCWKKNQSNFIEEGIFFDSLKLYNYFLEFMIEVFYTYGDKDITKDDYTDSGLLIIWEDIFSYNSPKTQSDIDTLIEIYRIFEKSLKKQ